MSVSWIDRWLRRRVQKSTITLSIQGPPIELNYALSAKGWFDKKLIAWASEQQKRGLIEALLEARKMAFYAKVQMDDIEKTESFSWAHLDEPISVNLWDELDEDGSTSLRVDTTSLPLKESRDVLWFIQERIKNTLLARLEIATVLVPHDDAQRYPGLLATNNRFVMQYWWELRFKGVNAAQLEALADGLQLEFESLCYEGTAFDFSFES